jgi:ParB family transcriptional regulator, chromosome partitioning protein
MKFTTNVAEVAKPESVIKVENGILFLNPDRVRPFRGNPRKWLNPVRLQELQDSIEAIGQTEPVKVVRIYEIDYDFELASGQRRWTCCKKLCRPLKAILVKIPEERRLIDYFISDEQREPYEHIEAARALNGLLQNTDTDVTQLSKELGRSTTWIYQHLRLLKLPQSVQDLMEPSRPENSRLGMNVALEISKLPPDLQEKTAQNIVNRQMKINEAKNYISVQAAKHNIKLHSKNWSPREDRRSL